jgi:phage antirepressor YoqD-like protein
MSTPRTLKTRRGSHGDSAVVQTKTAKREKSAKSARKSERKPKRSAKRERQLEHTERNGAHAYAERVPIIADQLADDGGSATVKELFKALSTGKTGLFATERRVAAAIRYDGRQMTPMFEHVNGAVTLRKRQRTAKRSKPTVSRKRTRSAA